jgi:hypothetical protein
MARSKARILASQRSYLWIPVRKRWSLNIFIGRQGIRTVAKEELRLELD